MNRRLPQWIAALAIAALPLPAPAQSAEPDTPTLEQIEALYANSDAYVRLIVEALAWKAPMSQDCAGSKLRLESIAQRAMAAGPLTVPDAPQARLEAFQRAEENMMSRHAVFSRELYQAVRQGCLGPPPPPGGESADPGAAP